jgi:ABC-2 type transport system permease protein
MSAIVSDSLILARRQVAHIRQIPEKLLDVTLQPLMFTLLFAYVFGGVIHVPGGDYHEYLIGGILVQTLAFGMMGPGTAIATDLTEGFVDRFRTLPVSRAAYLLGHLAAEFGAAMLALLILAVSGLVVGWQINTDLTHAVAGFALLAVFSLGMICLGTLVGLIARSPDAVQGAAFLFVFPLTFLSNAFVPADGLPSTLQTIAEWNPFSWLAAAVRELFGNPTAVPSAPSWPLEHAVLSAWLFSLALLAVLLPLAVARFRARTTG